MSQNTKLPTTKPQLDEPTKPVKPEEVSTEDLKKIQDRRHIVIRC